MSDTDKQLQKIEGQALDKPRPALPLFKPRFSMVLMFFSFYWWVIRPRLLRWGAQPEETRHLAKENELIPEANVEATHAIEIDAPVSVVWHWLAQMGRENSGFYGIDRLNNHGMPSVTHLRQDLPPLELGQRLDNELKVFDFVPETYLLIGGFAIPNLFGGNTDIICGYHLTVLDDNRTRLIVRMRGYSEGKPWTWFSNRILEITHSLNTIEQLQGIKSRAESKPPKP